MYNFVAQIAFTIIAASALALATRFIVKQKVHFGYFAIAMAAFLVSALAMLGGYQLQTAIPLLAGLQWNWVGKICATIAPLAFLTIPGGPGTKEAGITLQQKTGSIGPALIAIALLCAFSWGVEIWANDGTDTGLKRLAFQAIMPGISEELFFRGILLALLMRAFDERWSLFQSPVGPAAAIVTFIFAAGHGFTFADGQFHFSALIFFVTGTLGFGLLWIRQRTGSILLPILAHNLINIGNSFF
jgi:hypothetical protein